MRSLSDFERAAYYGASLRALHYMESRRPTGRRFGQDADARWAAFKGDLGTGDRLDLLFRDADAEWPASFAARSTFAFRAVAEDEPFGAGWVTLDDVSAETLWREVTRRPAPESLRGTIEACARTWEVPLRWPKLSPVAPAERLVVTGPSVVVAAQVAFSEARDLDWGEQVTVIASNPAHRHLAGLAAAFLGLTRPARVVAAGEAAAVALDRRTRVLASKDASEADLAALRALAAERLEIVS